MGCAIGHVRYINILTWLRGFRVKIANFSSFFCIIIPKGDLDTKKTTPNIEVWPESLGAMLEYWYIERGLLRLKSPPHPVVPPPLGHNIDSCITVATRIHAMTFRTKFLHVCFALLPLKQSHKRLRRDFVPRLSLFSKVGLWPFYSCVLSYLAMNASEAGGDLALIQTSPLFSCKCKLVSTRRTTWFAE